MTLSKPLLPLGIFNDGSLSRNNRAQALSARLPVRP